MIKYRRKLWIKISRTEDDEMSQSWVNVPDTCHIHVWTHPCMLVRVHSYLDLLVCAHVCLSTFLGVWTHLYVSVRICVHPCVSICVCIHPYPFVTRDYHSSKIRFRPPSETESWVHETRSVLVRLGLVLVRLSTVLVRLGKVPSQLPEHQPLRQNLAVARPYFHKSSNN